MQTTVSKDEFIRAENRASTAPIVFKIVTNKSDLEKVFKFRYQIYIEEMHRLQKWADHSLKVIREPLDRTGIIVAAFQGDEVVATCRLNISRDTTFDYAELYDFEQFEKLFPGRVSFITKLMIKPELRKGTLFIRFMKELFKILRTEGVCVNVIDCNDHLVKPFAKLGFQQYQEKINHPEYGHVTPMVMYNRDEVYFETVRSPLSELCRFFNAMEKLPVFEEPTIEPSVPLTEIFPGPVNQVQLAVA